MSDQKTYPFRCETAPEASGAPRLTVEIGPATMVVADGLYHDKAEVTSADDTSWQIGAYAATGIATVQMEDGTNRTCTMRIVLPGTLSKKAATPAARETIDQAVSYAEQQLQILFRRRVPGSALVVFPANIDGAPTIALGVAPNPTGIMPPLLDKDSSAAYPGPLSPSSLAKILDSEFNAQCSAVIALLATAKTPGESLDCALRGFHLVQKLFGTDEAETSAIMKYLCSDPCSPYGLINDIWLEEIWESSLESSPEDDSLYQSFCTLRRLCDQIVSVSHEMARCAHMLGSNEDEHEPVFSVD